MESVGRTFGELFPQPAEAPPFWKPHALADVLVPSGLALDAMVLPRPDETEKALEIWRQFAEVSMPTIERDPHAT